MYKVKKGRRVIAIAMAQNNFGGAWAHIFLDCIQCDQSIGLRFESNDQADAFSDKRAARIFKKHGWTIKPTLCPTCQQQAALLANQ